MRPYPQENDELRFAFHSELHSDAIAAIKVFPSNAYGWNVFKVQVKGEILAIPVRIYHDAVAIKTAKLTELQGNLLDCLLTRHHDGTVRQNT